MQSVGTDQIEAQVFELSGRHPQPFGHNFAGQAPAVQRTRSGVGNLGLRKIAVQNAYSDLQLLRGSVPSPAPDSDTVGPALFQFHATQVRRDIGDRIMLWIVNLIEQLLRTGRDRDLTATAADLCNSAITVRIDLGKREPETSECLGVLPASRVVVTAGDLAGALEQVPNDGAAAQSGPVVVSPPEFVHERCEEHGGVRHTP